MTVDSLHGPTNLLESGRNQIDFNSLNPDELKSTEMSGFEKVAELDEIPSLGRKSIIINDEIPALLFRVDEAYYCVEDVCSHDGQPLTNGPFDGKEITCPRHGARFDVTSGRACAFPATEPIRVFPVEIRSDGIYVADNES